MRRIDDFSAISWTANNRNYPLLGFAPWRNLYRLCALFLTTVGVETAAFYRPRITSPPFSLHDLTNRVDS